MGGSMDIFCALRGQIPCIFHPTIVYGEMQILEYKGIAPLQHDRHEVFHRQCWVVCVMWMMVKAGPFQTGLFLPGDRFLIQ